MGMLMTYHKGYRAEGDPQSGPTPGTKAALKAEAKALGLSTEGNKADLERRLAEHKADEGTEVDLYADLTDDQVLEAYATNVPDGTAEDRDTMVSELQALDAEGDTPDE